MTKHTHAAPHKRDDDSDTKEIPAVPATPLVPPSPPHIERAIERGDPDDRPVSETNPDAKPPGPELATAAANLQAGETVELSREDVQRAYEALKGVADGQGETGEVTLGPDLATFFYEGRLPDDPKLMTRTGGYVVSVEELHEKVKAMKAYLDRDTEKERKAKK